MILANIWKSKVDLRHFSTLSKLSSIRAMSSDKKKMGQGKHLNYDEGKLYSLVIIS